VLQASDQALKNKTGRVVFLSEIQIDWPGRDFPEPELADERHEFAELISRLMVYEHEFAVCALVEQIC